MDTILIMMSTMMFSTKNPVKLSTLILALGTTMFLLIWSLSGLTWVPLIMSLLFTGGILIMFMILSTFHPNESPSKNKKKSFLWILILITIMSAKTSSSELQPYNPSTSKIWFQNMSSSLMVTLLIILYFMIFMKILKKEENCMKMIMC